MTKDEFVRLYAARSRMTIEQLNELNQEARPCDCGDEICQGWQMVTSLTGATVTCPKCGRTSANPQDIAEGYCGHCHAWTTGPDQPGRDPLGYRPTTLAEIDNTIYPGAWKGHPEGESNS